MQSAVPLRSAGTHSFVVLDGMRGVAAIAVLLFHAKTYFGGTLWLPSAYLAVDLFFVLSGFVLAYAYEHKFAAGMSTWEFMRARLIRLYPLYLIALIIPVLSLVAGSMVGYNVKGSLVQFASALPWNILFLPVPHAGQLFLDGPAWSLFFELLVNFIFVLTWRLLTNRVLLITSALSAVALVACMASFGSLEGGNSGETFVVGFARVFYSFPLGILLYRTHRDLSILGMFTAVPLIGTVLFLAPPSAWGFVRGFYDLMAIMFISPTLVALGAHAAVKSASSIRCCAVLGRTSYGIYILHMSAMFLFLRICQKLLGSKVVAYPDAATAIFLGVMFVIALLLYKHYDDPLRRWLTNAASTKNQTAGAV